MDRAVAAPALEVAGLSKAFGPVRAVDSLDFVLCQGSILSLLGPNGAGKSTTIKMLYGSIRPDTGTIRYGGRDFARERRRIKLEIGVCSQNDTLDYDLDVTGNLEVFGTYYHLRPAAARERARELLDRFGLDSYRALTARQLSGGLKRRLQIARALVNRPRVLFLDEPTVGLDPHARRELWDLLHGLRRDGIAILLTTHYMEEAEVLSDRVIIMDRGRIIEEGRAEEMIARDLGDSVLQVTDTPDARRIAGEAGADFFAGYGRLTVTAGREAVRALAARFKEGEIVIRRPNLEDLFIKLTGKGL